MTRSAIFMTALCAISVHADAQAARELPFSPGERFEYAGKVKSKISGRGTLWVEGPSDVRGVATWTLHSDMEGSVAFIRASDKNASWIDPVRFTSLRYTSRERHLINKHDDVVEIFPAEKRWTSQAGLTGVTSTDVPLDELSFLYYLRTLPLTGDSTITLSRHFDSARNPTTVTVVGREDVDVGAGRFHAIIVEMRVRDTRRYNGEGVIRFAFSDDKCRLILRIESDVPDAGKATLGLMSYTGLKCECTSIVAK